MLSEFQCHKDKPAQQRDILCRNIKEFPKFPTKIYDNMYPLRKGNSAKTVL